MTPETELRSRTWAGITISTGFYIPDMIRSLLPFADSQEATESIQNVCTLLDQSSKDNEAWQAAAENLGALLRAHPDAHQESGSWYSGAPSICALAAAYEAALYGLHKNSPTPRSNHELAFRVFKYAMRAMQQDPQRAMNFLAWLNGHSQLAQPER